MNKRLTNMVVVGIILLALSFSTGFGQGDNSVDPLVNLGCLAEAMVSGSVDTSMDGGKLPGDILWDPSTNDYKQESSWHEYGLGYGVTAGGLTPENPMWWMCEWPTAKNINFITVVGVYGNQEQISTGWSVQIDVDGAWVNLAKADNGWPADTLKGITGWLNDALLEIKLIDLQIFIKAKMIYLRNNS